MKFTVLLSLYLKEKPEYLRQCLQSIKDNTLKPDQVVIVYDGPVGVELEKVVDSFRNSLAIDVINLPENRGLGNALNCGLKYCDNEIVVRMDTDDVCTIERFSMQINFLENHPSVALLGGAINEFNEDMTRSLGIRFSVPEHNQIKEYCKKRNPFNHMTVAFKKTVIEEVGGYYHHFLMEDYNLWLRVISAGHQTHNMDNILVDVRAGQSMIFRRRGIAYVKSEIQLANLKYQLNIDGLSGVISCALLRIVPRLLPTSMLNILYKKLRK